MSCRPRFGHLRLLGSGTVSSRRCLSQQVKRVQSIRSLLQSSADNGTATDRPDIEVLGHVRTVRNQKRRSFLELGDGSTTHVLQALLDPSQAAGLGTGTAVVVSGSWQPCPPGKEQSHELHAREVRIVGEADAESYPISKKYHSPEFLRTVPHLRLRVPFNALIARLRSECEFILSSYFHKNDFIRVHPPIITSSDAEGAGGTFAVAQKPDATSGQKGSPSPPVDSQGFFRGPRYLTVSSQLHLEAYVHEHPRVWTLSPTFRAEKSDTQRHLSEFYMLEAEMRTDSLTEIMNHIEDLLRNTVAGLQSSPVATELLSPKRASESSIDNQTSDNNKLESHSRLIQNRWDGLRRQYWPRITYADAIKLLQAAADASDTQFTFYPRWKHGLQLEHERFIAAEVGQGSPVFVTDYPRSTKPFYMLPSDPQSRHPDQVHGTVACFDLLLPDICEVLGGSLREHRAVPLERNMRRQGFLRDTSADGPASQDLSWYLDLRKYGSVPHGGYGLGFDRLIGYLAGVNNVRDVVPWPRYYGRCDG